MARTAGRATKKSIDEPKYICCACGKSKKKSEFYVSTNSKNILGVEIRACKSCSRDIALNKNLVTGNYAGCTKGSIIEALEILDKPYLERVYEASYAEWADDTSLRKQSTVWDSYIKNIAMPQYRLLRHKDSDLFATYVEDAKKAAAMEKQQEDNAKYLANSTEINSEFERNKRDVSRLLGYDPFINEPLEDQPLLYSQLIGYLDLGGDGNEDMMRTSSAITIVRGFLQQAKIDDKIVKAMANSNASSAELKQLLDSKKNIAATISLLAEQSCLSLKHNKNSSKGENTWTGKIKKIRDMDLRDAEINGFDIGTCRGMQQVLELSDASIMKQLRLDESEWSDMVAEQRQMIVNLQKERDIYKEINRIILRENLDLKDTLEDNNISLSENVINMRELFSPLSEVVSTDKNDEDDE